MPKYGIKLRGTPKIIHLDAATFEDTNDALDVFGPERRILKDAKGKEVGWFSIKEITGWWIEQENSALEQVSEFLSSDERKKDFPK